MSIPRSGSAAPTGDDRFEAEGAGLQRAVAEAYEEIATIAADRVIPVDAYGSVEEVHERVLDAFAALFLRSGNTSTHRHDRRRWRCDRAPAAGPPALSAALAGPHAYLFPCPRPAGRGKRAAARAFAAEILAAPPRPDDARRRALLDPSPHPDLVWLAPTGAQHMVEAVRERVIRAASYRPFEGGKRVFVLEAAEAMRDESQNALLKTLEEPPPFAHLILLSSEPEALLETVASRCQPVDFAPLPAEAIEAGFRRRRPRGRRRRPPAGGRPRPGPLLLDRRGPRASRRGSSCRAARRRGAAAPGAAADGGRGGRREAEAAARERWTRRRRPGSNARPEKSPTRPNGPAVGAAPRSSTLASRSAQPGSATSPRSPPAPRRSSSTAIVSTGCAPQAEGLDPSARPARRRAGPGHRRRLDLNVSEELALEALFFRLEREIDRLSAVPGGAGARAADRPASSTTSTPNTRSTLPGSRRSPRHYRELIAAGELIVLLPARAPTASASSG